MKVLVTCPPMLKMLSEFLDSARENGIELFAAKTSQVLTEDELVRILPGHDGWIIGDDPATFRVFEAGKRGGLKAAVKWGVGVDNIDFEACESLHIPITNTPNMFGGEVADLAVGYIIALARHSCYIDREIRSNHAWPKPAGISISGKTIGIVGYGDIGFSTAKRLSGFDVRVIAYDPAVSGKKGLEFVQRSEWPSKAETLDFLVFTCALNADNFHMLNAQTIGQLKPGVRIVNVARGSLIDEHALTLGLVTGHVASAALDVFEQEPLPADSRLREMPQCIFGSHNGSNTLEAVRRASFTTIEKIAHFLYEND